MEEFLILLLNKNISLKYMDLFGIKDNPTYVDNDLIIL